MKTLPELALLLCGALAIAGGVSAAPVVSRLPGDPVADCSGTSHDSIVPLRVQPAADSVLFPQGDATIILSMRDIEELIDGWRAPAELEREQAAMRRAYEEAGWVQLEGQLGYRVAPRLMEQGKASIRWNPTGTLLPSMRIGDERVVFSGWVAVNRLFCTLDGSLVLLELKYIINMYQHGPGRNDQRPRGAS